MAIMTMLLSEYANEPIDVLHTIGMLLIHDLVEIDAGDTYAYDEEERRHRLTGRKKRPTGFMVFFRKSRERCCMICGLNLRRRRRQKQSSRV